MLNLTDSDSDSLFAAMKDDMPLMCERSSPTCWRILNTGALTITVTDTEIVVSGAKPPQTVVYRVDRKPRLH